MNVALRNLTPNGSECTAARMNIGDTSTDVWRFRVSQTHRDGKAFPDLSMDFSKWRNYQLQLPPPKWLQSDISLLQRPVPGLPCSPSCSGICNKYTSFQSCSLEYMTYLVVVFLVSCVHCFFMHHHPCQVNHKAIQSEAGAFFWIPLAPATTCTHPHTQMYAYVHK